jgi:molybdopterin converting factor small subunit
MMKVHVRVFATLREYLPSHTPGSTFEIELPAGATLADLVGQLNLPQDEVNLIYVNARAQALSYGLNPADEVGIFPKIGGG